MPSVNLIKLPLHQPIQYESSMQKKIGIPQLQEFQIACCRNCSFESLTKLLRKFSTIEMNSSIFSSWGRWPHCLITLNDDPGMTRESLSAFHEGTIRSVSPVTIRTVYSNNHHQLCSRFN